MTEAVEVSTYGVKLERSTALHLPPHDDTSSVDGFEGWCRQHVARGDRLAVDLFSGAGGLSLGLTQAGWTVAAAVDHDPWALRTHRANFPGLTIGIDLGDRRERDRLVALLSNAPIDLIAGGPPCQPFSRAGRSKIRSLVESGRREADDDRRDLWRAFVDVVIRVRPRAVLMENVPDMALGDDMRVVRTIVDRLEKAGYHTQVRLADAWKHGVPQHRQRLIILGRLDHDEFPWPAESTMETSVRAAIEDLPRLGLGTGNVTSEYEGRPASGFARQMRRDAERGIVHDHVTRPVRDDDREIFAGMDSRTLYANIPEPLRRYKADTFDDKYKRLDWDDRSRSITAHIAKDGYWYIHPEENRTLTVREAARIQTFPDRFRFAGHRSDQFRQIGNAVPPKLGEAAVRALVPVSQSPSGMPPPGLRRWKHVQSLLTKWAKARRRDESWYLLPGTDMTPAVAALTAMLRGTSAAGPAMAILRGRAKVSSQQLAVLCADLPSRITHSAADRLQAARLSGTGWDNAVGVEAACGLRPAERDMYWLLLGDDLLLTTQAATRVAARVCGTDSDARNRLSNGRLDMARIVGSGPDAQLRMAAIQLIGSTVCRPRDSQCEKCPLREACSSRRASLTTGAASQA